MSLKSAADTFWRDINVKIINNNIDAAIFLHFTSTPA